MQCVRFSGLAGDILGGSGESGGQGDMIIPQRSGRVMVLYYQVAHCQKYFHSTHRNIAA